MKKNIIVLMGLFTLLACSEDSYQEADKMNETSTVEGGSESGMTTFGSMGSYSSPFAPHGVSGNQNIPTTFQNTTPLKLELQPYGQDINYQTFVLANGGTVTPTVTPGGNFTAAMGNTINVNAGTHVLRDPNSPMPVIVPPYSNIIGNPLLAYDFGDFMTNYRFHHYGKVYYFRYKISNSRGVLKTGLIKHEFYNDFDDPATISAGSGDWTYLTDVDGITGYEASIMYSPGINEMCICNKKGSTTPIPSSVAVTDPLTSIGYNLKFYNNSTGIFLRLN